jgi:lipopolysaccharide/colanic/teichoic acid biosynthesis glycosyltransferase
VLKRTVDLVSSLVALLVTLPLVAVIALAIALSMGRPVLFVQQRAGKDGTPFSLIKFRTMRDPDPGQDEMSSDAARLTRLGRALRTTSLDELPTLLNVIRGEMSLVGPRPLPVRYLDRYSPEQRRRHEVRPGVTGWAQVNGRNSISWREKFDLDLYYVDHHCAALDLRILLRTMTQVLRQADVAHAGHATMPEFTGPESMAPDES